MLSSGIHKCKVKKKGEEGIDPSTGKVNITAVACNKGMERGLFHLPIFYTVGADTSNLFCKFTQKNKCN